MSGFNSFGAPNVLDPLTICYACMKSCRSCEWHDHLIPGTPAYNIQTLDIVIIMLDGYCIYANYFIEGQLSGRCSTSPWLWPCALLALGTFKCLGKTQRRRSGSPHFQDPKKTTVMWMSHASVCFLNFSHECLSLGW